MQRTAVFEFLGVCLCGSLVSLLLTPRVIQLATRFNMLDIPGARRVHKQPVPRGGGIAVFAAFHISFLFAYCLQPDDPQRVIGFDWYAVFAPASALLLLLGLWDDRTALRAQTKLLGQIAVATILFAGDVRAGGVLGIKFPLALDYVATVLWFVGLINAFNLIDGFDGVASGLAAIAALGIGGTFIFRDMQFQALLCAGLIGSCLGFLRYNLNPAKIFLGDSGSMFLGLTLASIALATASKGTALASVWVPILALGVPVFDTALAVWRRVAKRLAGILMFAESKSGLMSADMEHLHHRLVKMGLTPRNVTASMYLASSLLVLIGLLGLYFHERALGIYAIFFTFIAFIIFRYIASIEMWQSGLLVVHLLEERSRPLAVLGIYTVMDLAGLSGALFVSVYLTTEATLISAVLQQWWQRFPLWCLPAIVFILLIEVFLRQKNTIDAELLAHRAVLSCVVFLCGLGIIELAVIGPSRSLLQAGVYTALAYSYYSASRRLPASVIARFVRRQTRFN